MTGCSTRFTSVNHFPYHPITKTKLTLILTLTLIPTLTLLTPLTLLNATSPNCTSKRTKFASFQQTSPQNDPDNAIVANALHHGHHLRFSHPCLPIVLAKLFQLMVFCSFVAEGFRHSSIVSLPKPKISAKFQRGHQREVG